MKQFTTLLALGLMSVLLVSCVSLTPDSEIKSNPNTMNYHSPKLSDNLKMTANNEKQSSIVQSVLISNSINDVSVGSTSVWVATDKGVSMLDRAKNTWKHYTKDNGLGSDNVKSVVLDGKWVWFGTDDGVSRYDTSSGEWKTFRSKDGLKGSKVYCITIDRNYVWFGTDGGLNRYDKNIDSWAARTKKDGLTSDNITSIIITGDYMWVGTLWSGVNRYDITTDSWNAYSKKDGLIDTAISTIAATDKFIWFGTSGAGISLYDRTNQTFVKNYTKTDFLASNDIRSIIVDGNHVWIGSANGGVQRYIDIVDTWVRYTQTDGLPSNNITSIKAYGNEIWFGSYNNGLAMYDKVSNKWTKFIKADTIPSDDINGVTRDSKGELWIATAKGIARYSYEKEEWVKYGKESGLTTEFTTTVTADNNQIWVGTSRGLASFDTNSGQWKYYTKTNGLSHDFITSLKITDHRIWIGTNKGLVYMDTTGSNPDCICIDELKGRSITAISNSGNCLWIGTENGLWRYDIDTGKSRQYKENAYINTILCWGDNNVWVGSRSGILGYDASKDIFAEVNTGNVILPDSNIVTMDYDRNNERIWVGKPDGLVYFDIQSDKWLEPNNNIKGFLRQNIRSLYIYENLLWLATASGLIEYRIDDGSWYEHKALMTREPFREPSVSNIELDGDYVWFSNWSASRNGAIVRYDRRNNTWQWFGREVIFKDMKSESMTEIRRIIVDRDAVWFATDYGILRYDKSKDIWEHFAKGDGLVDNNIGYITCGKNVVWVSYWSSSKLTGAEISVYDKRSKVWKTIAISNLIYPRESVDVIEADGDDAWVSVGSSGIRKINIDGEQILYTKENGIAQNNASSITVDGDEVWFGHRYGWGGGSLSRYNKITGQWKKYSENDVLAGNNIQRIIVTERRIWVLYSYGTPAITTYDKKTDEWMNIKPSGSHGSGWGSGVEDIAEDGDYLWIGTDGSWIKRFHMSSWTWTSFDYSSGLLSSDVNDFALKADDRYVWVGSEIGLSRYDKLSESWTNFIKLNTLVDDRVSSVVVDDRYIWCGTSNGLSRYDKNYGQWKNHRHSDNFFYNANESYSNEEMKKLTEQRRNSLIDDSINTLAVDDRYLWVGTKEGANRYDKITDKWDRFQKENGLPGIDVSSIVVDGYDVWMGTNSGLCKFPRMSDNLNAWVSYTSGIEIRQTAITKEYATALVSNEVWCVDADQDYIWIGTMRGISRYDKKKDMWITFTTEDGLPTNEIGSVRVDGSLVWFGTGEGIILYNKETQDWVTYSTSDGLSSDKITSIARDDKYIWFGTFDAGIIRYDKENKKWESLSKKEGLSHNCVLSIAVDGDQVWIGTQRGLSRYDKVKNTWTVFTKHSDSEDV